MTRYIWTNEKRTDPDPAIIHIGGRLRPVFERSASSNPSSPPRKRSKTAPTAATIHAIAARADDYEQSAIFHQRRLTATHAPLTHQIYPKHGDQE